MKLIKNSSNIYGLYNILSNMKTTIDITDRTLREIIEASLRKYLTEKKAKSNFELKSKSFCGSGLQPEASLDWSYLSEKIY